jgi:hypothetical protein
MSTNLPWFHSFASNVQCRSLPTSNVEYLTYFLSLDATVCNLESVYTSRPYFLWQPLCLGDLRLLFDTVHRTQTVWFDEFLGTTLYFHFPLEIYVRKIYRYIYIPVTVVKTVLTISCVGGGAEIWQIFIYSRGHQLPLSVCTGCSSLLDEFVLLL